jgi:hypothetical protein
MIEGNLEIIPEGDSLVVVFNTDAYTTQIRGQTQQILDLARTILAAESKWIPTELVGFARDILLRRPTKISPLASSTLPANVQITNDDEYEQAKRARDVMKQYRSFLRAIFSGALEGLEKEVGAFWAEKDGPHSVQ